MQDLPTCSKTQLHSNVKHSGQVKEESAVEASTKASLNAPKKWHPQVSQTIRVAKKDSAFFYAVFEASEGVVSYTTLSHPFQSHWRDIRLSYSPTTSKELQKLLDSMNHPIEFFSSEPDSESSELTNI